MPRPRKQRSIHRPPTCDRFKPAGIRGRHLPRTALELDEFEAVRLADYEGLDHAAAAETMEISRPTFSRLVERARGKIAAFLVEGTYLVIDGGDVHFRGNRFRCEACGHLFNLPLDQDPDRCPACGAETLVDLAGSFGHGPCCDRHHRRRGRS